MANNPKLNPDEVQEILRQNHIMRTALWKIANILDRESISIDIADEALRKLSYYGEDEVMYAS